MSTHNISFHGEIRKILCGYPLLSVAMSDKMLFFSIKNIDIFSYFSVKTYVVGTH